MVEEENRREVWGEIKWRREKKNREFVILSSFEIISQWVKRWLTGQGTGESQWDVFGGYFGLREWVKSRLSSLLFTVVVAFFCISWMNYDVSDCVWRKYLSLTHTQRMEITASVLLQHTMLTCRSMSLSVLAPLCVELIFKDFKNTSGEQRGHSTLISLPLWIQHRLFKLTHVV